VDEVWLCIDVAKKRSKKGVSEPENGNSSIERQIIETVLEESGGSVYSANGAVDRLPVPSNP
jgi:hypothetical protein